MLPTFVIGLREGVEASLIVGIIAAFLASQGRRDALRWVGVGTGLAVALCLALGIGLYALNQNLQLKQQSALETIVSFVALAMVTWMIVWMRKHARELKGHLEASAGAALAQGSVKALVLMAFIAVLREGFETAFFLVALFTNAQDKTVGVSGALLGIGVAVVIGVLLYRGGLRINLQRFFRATGVVLVVVVAGLAAFGMRAALEAGWINQTAQLADFTSFVKPGSVQSALLTGVLGIQPKPLLAEGIAWLAVFVPLMALVLWPQRRRPTTRRPAPVAAAGQPVGSPT